MHARIHREKDSVNESKSSQPPSDVMPRQLQLHFFVFTIIGWMSLHAGLFTLQAQTPTVTTGTTTEVTDISAVMNGSINANGGTFTLSFEYGMTTSYGSTLTSTPSSASGSSTIAVTATYSQLLPYTTYHFRLKARNLSNVTTYGADQMFTTGPPLTPPTVTGALAISSVKSASASIQAGSVVAGGAITTIEFEYGPTTDYGSIVSFSGSASVAAASSVIPSGQLTGLTGSTTYHVRCRATSALGVAYSPDAVFTTQGTPQVTTMPATGVTDIAAVLNGTADANGGSVSLSFQYGTTTNYGTTLISSPSSAAGSGTVAVSVSPSGLLPNTTYHFRLRATDNASVSFFGPDMTFTTAAASSAPVLTTAAASSVRAGSATLTAAGFSTGSSQATLAVEYGPTTAYGSEMSLPDPLPLNTSYSSLGLSVGGLIPETVYHFRVKATNSEGTGYGSDASFTTLTAPTVTTGAVISLTDVAATLNGTANANTGSYTASFEYGLTTGYGSSVTASPSSVNGTSSTALTTSPPSLQPGTTYHYRLKLNDTVTSFYGEDATFVTPAPSTPPSVTSAAAASVTATTAVLKATSVKSGASAALTHFQYGTTTGYGLTSPSIPEPINQNYVSISVQVFGLQPLTTYHYRPVSTNGQGTTYGSDVAFTTLGLPVITTTLATGVTEVTAALNATVNPSGVSSTVSFEYGLTPAYGSKASPATATVTGSSTVSKSATVSTLSPNTTYHYRARLDNADGTHYGADAVVTTAPEATLPAVEGYFAPSATAISADLGISSVRAGSSPATVVVEYGLTTAYGNEVAYRYPIPAGGSSSVYVEINGLQPNTTYRYRVRATNNVGTAYGTESSFTTTNLPIVTTLPATAVTDTSAVLNGTAKAGGGALLYLTFEYWTGYTYPTTSYANPQSASGSSTATASLPITGLSPNTEYHCRLVGQESGTPSQFSGAEIVFTTTGPGGGLPAVSTGVASSLRATSAGLIAGSINAGAAAATVAWEYGLSTAYGSEVSFYQVIPAGEPYAYGTAYGSATGLTPATTYHYRAKITNSIGTTYGADATFTTSALSLSAVTGNATQIRTTSATITGAFQNNADTSTLSFEWGLDTNYGTLMPAAPATASASNGASTNASAALSGLLPDTIYHYRLVNANPNGNTFGADMSFKTLSATAPVAITGTATGSTTGTATVRGIVNASDSTITPLFEYGLTTAYGFFTTALPQPISGATDTPVSAIVSGLTSNAVYHYRVVATGPQGTTYGDDATVQMVQPPIVVTNAPSFVGSDGARLQATLTPSGTTTAYFEYGTTAAYGSKTSNSSGFGSFMSASIGSLDFSNFLTQTYLIPRTSYHYRAVASNAGGTVYGDDVTFVTDYAKATHVITPVTQITSTSATLNVDVTESGGTDSVGFYYGLFKYSGIPPTIPATPSTVSGIGTTSVSLVLSGLNPGTKYYYSFKNTRYQTGGTSSYTGGDYTFTTLTRHEDWRLQNFGTTANSGDAADLLDYDQDGIPNIAEFAFGLNPKQNSVGGLPLGVRIGGDFVISFSQPDSAMGINYGAEWNSTLTGSWNPVTDTGTPPQHIFSVPIGAEVKNVFMRLRVTTP